MDLRLSKRALIDKLVELDNLPESSLLEYSSPLFENMDKREVMENLEKIELHRNHRPGHYKENVSPLIHGLFSK